MYVLGCEGLCGVCAALSLKSAHMVASEVIWSEPPTRDRSSANIQADLELEKPYVNVHHLSVTFCWFCAQMLNT